MKDEYQDPVAKILFKLQDHKLDLIIIWCFTLTLAYLFLFITLVLGV